MKNLVRCIAAFALVFTAVTAFGQSSTVVMEIERGWNLKGNSLSNSIVTTTMFGTFSGNGTVPNVTDNIISVWKWDACSSRWQFYTPRMDASTLASYAASKGYDVLSYIYPGEGFWVFSRAETAVVHEGYPANYILDNWNLSGGCTGWNLAASPVSATAEEIAANMTQTPPSPSDMSMISALATLWAWAADSGKWYFYAPSLAASGMDALRNYQWQKGYLSFEEKKIEPGDGFWANIQPQPQVPTVNCGYCKGSAVDTAKAH